MRLSQLPTGIALMTAACGASPIIRFEAPMGLGAIELSGDPQAVIAQKRDEALDLYRKQYGTTLSAACTATSDATNTINNLAKNQIPFVLLKVDPGTSMICSEKPNEEIAPPAAVQSAAPVSIINNNFYNQNNGDVIFGDLTPPPAPEPTPEPAVIPEPEPETEPIPEPAPTLHSAHVDGVIWPENAQVKAPSKYSHPLVDELKAQFDKLRGEVDTLAIRNKGYEFPTPQEKAELDSAREQLAKVNQLLIAAKKRTVTFSPDPVAVPKNPNWAELESGCSDAIVQAGNRAYGAWGKLDRAIPNLPDSLSTVSAWTPPVPNRRNGRFERIIVGEARAYRYESNINVRLLMETELAARSPQDLIAALRSNSEAVMGNYLYGGRYAEKDEKMESILRHGGAAGVDIDTGINWDFGQHTHDKDTFAACNTQLNEARAVAGVLEGIVDTIETAQDQAAAARTTDETRKRKAYSEQMHEEEVRRAQIAGQLQGGGTE